MKSGSIPSDSKPEDRTTPLVPTSGNPDVALCLAGGGFLAVAVHTGLVTGLLRAANKHDISSSYDLEKSKLLHRINIIVSNSGGSWFASQLMYSDFVTLVEEMAKESTASGVEELFKHHYTQKWIERMTPTWNNFDGAQPPSFGTCTQQLIDSGPQQLIDSPPVDSTSANFEGTSRESIQKPLWERFILWLISPWSCRLPEVTVKIPWVDINAWWQDLNMIITLYLAAGGLTWHNFVEELLTSTSSIETTQTLGSGVKGWCRGKTWVINTSSVTPLKGSTTPSYTIWLDNFLSFAAAAPRIRPYVQYAITGSKRKEAPLNSLIPSRFSIVLGGVISDISPLPVAASGLLQDLELSYEGQKAWLGSTINATAPQEGIRDPQPQAHLSLISAVACSSAFLGGLPSTENGRNVAAELKGDFAMWLAANEKDAGQAFVTARSLVAEFRNEEDVTQDRFDRIARAGVYGIIDGGYTDNTGIINAVAAGATELYVWLADLGGLYNLFQGGNDTSRHAFFGDTFFFQIFSKPMPDAIDEVGKFEKLNFTGGDCIIDFSIGTIMTKTVANRIVGIKEGISVTLHVFFVGSKLSIGILEDFNNYATLVDQISQALQLGRNKKIVNGMLKSLMHGSATFPGS